MKDKIPVLDSGNKVISYTHPARARKLIKSGKAVLFTKHPFVIKLGGNLHVRRNKMQIVSWTDFFREERDIYVMNMSGSQVSMTVKIGPDTVESIRILNNKKPRNLTNDVSFEALKNCSDLRKLVQRNPPALKIISEEEYKEYFDNLAKVNETSIEQEMLRANMMNEHVKNSLPDTNEDPKSLDQQREMRAGQGDGEDQLHPRVIGLCNQVGAHLKKDQMLPAGDLLEAFQGLEHEFKPNDFEYINGKGYYKVVKRWAASKMGAE